MNKFYRIILTLLLVVGISSVILAQEPVRYEAKLIKKFYSMGTASINGTYYPLGNALSRLFGKKLKKMATIAEPTAGSMANVEYLRQKRIDLALMQSDVAWMAYNGSDTYAGKPFKGLRVLAALYAEKIQIVVRADSSIKSLSDLRGKKIAVGEKDSGSAAGAIQILEAAGLKAETDYEIVYERFTKSTESLLDGYVDAVYYVGAVPADGITRLASKAPVRLIQIPMEIITKLTTAYPYYSSEIVAADSYKGQKDEVKTLGFKALLTCTEDMPLDDVITMLSVMYSNPKLVSEQNEVLVEISQEDSLKGVDPQMLHIGASKFFSLQQEHNNDSK